jgi:NAD(P)-dependent dehydrogenase (short-subunit alcohol dehydrogenase family)
MARKSRSLRSTPEVMSRVFAVNTIGVAHVLSHLPRLLPKTGRSVTGVLTARVGSIGDNGIGGWHSYRASKAALNQIVHGVGIELGRTHRDAVIAALHPGTVATPFTEGYEPKHGKVTAEEAARNLCDVMERLTRRNRAASSTMPGGRSRGEPPMNPRLVLILGDQLSEDIVALREADRERDVVVMAEVMDEAAYVPHHPKKIAFLFAAMRKFAAHLEGRRLERALHAARRSRQCGLHPRPSCCARRTPPARRRCWRPNPASSG